MRIFLVLSQIFALILSSKALESLLVAKDGLVFRLRLDNFHCFYCLLLNASIRGLIQKVEYRGRVLSIGFVRNVLLILDLSHFNGRSKFSP